MIKYALYVKNLNKSYGKIKAVEGANFYIPMGKVAGLVGPNGAGKSTIIKCITGFLNYSGLIKVLGSPQENLNKINIGYLAEKTGYQGNLTGEEYLKFYCNLYNVETPKVVINNKLKLVGLYDRRLDLIKTYSNGMKQRLGIARTLINDPKMLIYDEPMSGLDPSIKGKILDIISDISSDGKTILISSHQLKDIEDVCDWIILIKEGMIIHQGSIESVFNKIKMVKRLSILINNNQKERLREIKQDIEGVKHIKIKGKTVIIEYDISKVRDEEILGYLFKNKINFTLKQGTLDSMYRSVFDEQ
ncbi:MAG: ABC transporter ATP-binding protein [Thermoplasmata archaeon]